jgi:hypothetical protein
MSCDPFDQEHEVSVTPFDQALTVSFFDSL